MATFNILSRLAGGYAAAADEKQETERKATREQRLGISNVLSRMLGDPNLTSEAREAIGRDLMQIWSGKKGKVTVDLGKYGFQGMPEQDATPTQGFGGAFTPPPIPERVTPAPSPEAVTNLYLTREQIDNREAARERTLSEARARGTAAGTPRAPVKLQRVQIDDPSNPGQTIFASFNAETGKFQDTRGKNIESPLAPKKEVTHTPYLDFRESQIAAGVSPLDIPKLWNQQQVTLQRSNPSRMGLILSGVDSQTDEPVFVWVSGEERMKGEMPPGLAGIRPRLGGGEEAERLNTIVQSLLRSLEKGNRLYKLLGVALNPDLEGNDKEAIKAGRAAYKRWLKGPKGAGGVPPPPDERGRGDTHPEGTRAKLKDGTIVVKRGGKWVPVP